MYMRMRCACVYNRFLFHSYAIAVSVWPSSLCVYHRSTLSNIPFGCGFCSVPLLLTAPRQQHKKCFRVCFCFVLSVRHRAEVESVCLFCFFLSKVKKILTKMDTFKNILIPLPNMSKEYKPLIPFQHDKYLTPDSLKLAVLNSPRIRELCIEVAQTEQRKPNHVTKLVKEILDEIGLAHSLPAIRILGICLNKIFMGMTSGVYVHGSSIDLVKSRLSSGMCPVIYLPSHRSYADFILMSYICFVHDLEIPVSLAFISQLFAFACSNLLAE